MASAEQVRSLIDRIHQLNRNDVAGEPEAFEAEVHQPAKPGADGRGDCHFDEPSQPEPQAWAVPEDEMPASAPHVQPMKAATHQHARHPGAQQRGIAPFTGVMPDADTLRDWPHVVCNMSINPGQEFYFFETAPARPMEVTGPVEKYMITGHVGAGRFRVLVEKDLVDSILQANEVAPQALSQDPLDRAMVFELLCLDLIERMEARTGEEVQLDDVQLTHSEPAEGWLYLSCPALGHQPLIALATDAKLAPVLKQFVAANRAPREHQYSNKLSVSIGPVALPLGDCLALGEGDLLDCGFDPSGEVHGMLVRSDGCFWPVSIEGNVINVTGELQQPLPPPQSEMTDAVFEFGTLYLQHCIRRTVAPGMDFSFSQDQEGRTTMWLGSVRHATGTFEVYDDSLFVQIDGVEVQS